MSACVHVHVFVWLCACACVLVCIFRKAMSVFDNFFPSSCICFCAGVLACAIRIFIYLGTSWRVSAHCAMCECACMHGVCVAFACICAGICTILIVHYIGTSWRVFARAGHTTPPACGSRAGWSKWVCSPLACIWYELLTRSYRYIHILDQRTKNVSSLCTLHTPPPCTYAHTRMRMWQPGWMKQVGLLHWRVPGMSSQHTHTHTVNCCKITYTYHVASFHLCHHLHISPFFSFYIHMQRLSAMCRGRHLTVILESFYQRPRQLASPWNPPHRRIRLLRDMREITKISNSSSSNINIIHRVMLALMVAAGMVI